GAGAARRTRRRGGQGEEGFADGVGELRAIERERNVRQRDRRTLDAAYPFGDGDAGEDVVEASVGEGQAVRTARRGRSKLRAAAQAGNAADSLERVRAATCRTVVPDCLASIPFVLRYLRTNGCRG